MKDLESYLSTFNTDHLTLVGPMYNGVVDREEPIVFIDGGSKNYEGIGFIIGDGDSSSHTMHEKLDTNKNCSDLAYALSCVPKNIKSIEALGFLGGRVDHELINYGEFFSFLEQRQCKISLSSSLNLYSAQSLDFNFSGTFSLINSNIGKVQIEGNCEYTFNDLANKAYSSQFLSNISHGEFRVTAEMPFGVYQVNP